MILIIYLCGLVYTLGGLLMVGNNENWEDDALSTLEQIVLSLIAAILWPLYWGVILYQTWRGR